jgi:pilus assembly protein CpaB
MRNVRVLAVDQTSTPVPGANAVVGAVATIEVSPADAEALNLAQAQGDLSLTLRSYADISGPTGRTGRPVYSGGGARSASASVPAEPRTVRVWRGGQPTDTTPSRSAAADSASVAAAAASAAPVAAASN